jgi:hypothetical protein
VDSAKNKTKQKHTKASLSTSAAHGPKNKFDIVPIYTSTINAPKKGAYKEIFN